TPSRISRSGEMPYVEPQSCCYRKSPLTVHTNINGNAAPMPFFRRPKMYAIRNIEIKIRGHRPVSLSPRSDASASINKYMTGHTNGNDISVTAKTDGQLFTPASCLNKKEPKRKPTIHHAN